MNEWMNAEDKIRLENEERVMGLEAMLAGTMPGAVLMRGPRIFFCESCRAILAIAVRPDVEVVTDEQRQAMTRMAKQLDVPFIDDTERPPECKDCAAPREPLT